MDKQLYLRYYDDVYRFILYTTHDEELTRDLLQDTFYKFFNSNRQSINNEKAYLLKIARNLITDHYRKKRLIQMITLKEDKRIDEAPLPDSIVLKEELSVQLYKALLELQMKYREVIVLRYIEGYSVKETAHILNCNETRVKNDSARGLKTLRIYLEGGELDDRTAAKTATKRYGE